MNSNAIGILGPNGSGKSNVVDSLMFALGLTTTRNMRAEKLTDLINNISGRPDCAVQVTFINDGPKGDGNGIGKELKRMNTKKFIINIF